MKPGRIFPVFILTLTLAAAAYGQAKSEKGFKTIFDGKSFNGWKMADENQDAWTIQDGAFTAHGSRSHLYYVGDEKPFVNFELKIEARTTPGSNGGIYIHTQYQPTGWPKHGYEVQVNQTHTDWRRTGGLYGVQDVREQLVNDNEWYTYHIIVKGKHITIKVNDKVAVDWEEPADRKPGADFTRILDKGTFALQAHDPKSTIQYRNIRVKRLD
ncbi:MAG: DUF1080 domain-containing protein [Acidobacteriota bacterium]|nr:MAG: DUF1080 domain-containing protein [Acidobacteriota bacterium]